MSIFRNEINSNLTTKIIVSRMADRIIVMKDGKVAKIGTHEELI